MNKKAISPLISTLILIAFSIGLGAIVMSWGKGYIEERAEFVGQVSAAPLGCGNVKLSLWQVGEKAACTTDEKVRVYLENAPNSRFDTIEARLVGSGGIHTIASVSRPISKPEGFQVEFNTGTAGLIQQIKLIPVILIDSERHLCSDKAVVVEDSIPTC